MYATHIINLFYLLHQFIRAIQRGILTVIIGWNQQYCSTAFQAARFFGKRTDGTVVLMAGY